MFLRRYERRKNGKQHTYWALVESIRTARGSRQRVAAYLGELKKSQQTGWAQLGCKLSGQKRPALSLFDPPHYDEPDDDEPVLVKLKGIRLERLRDFGNVWLALGLWRLMGLDELLSDLMPEGNENVPWPTVAAILTVARFCEPASELHIAETWYRRTALEDLLDVAVEQIVEAMETKYGRSNRVWVMDRGMVSEANLKFVRERGGRYIVGTPKAMLRRFEQYLIEKDWHEVQAGVMVKLVPSPDGDETYVLARSEDRQAKEKAMHERFLSRMQAALEKLQASIESGRLKDTDQAHRRLGRLQERYWRVSTAFGVSIKPIPKPTDKARLSMSWKRVDRWHDWAALSEGCYLLRTNLTNTDPATLWKRYIQLTDAEWAFRVTKDELKIRPIWHQKPERVQAHILVCFLAYVMWKALAQWMHRSGLGDAPRTLLEEFTKDQERRCGAPDQDT